MVICDLSGAQRDKALQQAHPRVPAADPGQALAHLGLGDGAGQR